MNVVNVEQKQLLTKAEVVVKMITEISRRCISVRRSDRVTYLLFLEDPLLVFTRCIL